MNLRFILLCGALFFAISAKSQISWDGDAGDGLWSTALNWSTNTVPGDDDDVQIIGNFTVTVNSSDSCRSLVLQAQDANNRNAILQVTSGSQLGVGQTITLNDQNRANNDAQLLISGGGTIITGGDVTLNKDASAQNGNDMFIRLDDDNSLFRIGGALNLSFISGNNNNVRGIFLNQDSRLEADSVVVTLNGSNGSSPTNLLALNESGTDGDSAQVLITNNFTITNNSTGYQTLVVADFEGRLDVGGNLTYSGSGGLLSFELDRDASMRVGGSVSVSKGGNDNIQFYLNQNTAGAADDAQFDVVGDFSITKIDGDRFQLWLDDNADFNVGGSLSLITSNADDNDDDNLFLLQDDSRLDVAGTFSVNSTDTRNIDCLIDIFDNAELETGSVTITLSDADAMEVDVTDNGIFDIQGDFSVTNNSGSGLMVLDLEGSGLMTTTGSVTLNNSSSSITSVFIDDDAVLNVGTDLTLVRNTNGNTEVRLNQTSDGSAADAQLIVGNDFTLDKNDGDEVYITMSNGSDILIGRDLVFDEIEIDDDADFIQVTLNDQSGIDIDRNFTVNRSATRNGDLLMTLNNNSAFNVDGNITVTDNTGNTNFTLNDDATFTVDGTWTSTMDGIAGYEINLSGNSVLTAASLFNYSSTSSSGGTFSIDLEGTSVANFNAGATAINNSSGTTEVEIDGDAVLNVTGNFVLEHGTNSAISFNFNQNSDGSAADAQLNVSGNMTVTKTDGDELQVQMANDANWNVNGSLSFILSNTDDNGDFIAVRMSQQSQIDVDVNFSINRNETSRNPTTNFQLTENSLFNIDGNVSITDNGGANTYNLSDDASMVVDGTWTATLDGAAGFIMQPVGNSTLTIGGNFIVSETASGAGRIGIDADGTSTTNFNSGIDIDNFGSGATQIYIDGDAVVNVANNIDLAHGTNSQVEVYLNQVNAGSAADAQLNVTGNVELLKTDGDQVEVLLADNSDFTIGGTLTMTISNTDDDGDFVNYTLTDEARLTVTGVTTIDINDSRNTGFQFSVSDDAVADFNNNLSFASTGGVCEFRTADNGRLDVTGIWSNDLNDAALYTVSNNGSGDINVTGAYTFTKSSGGGDFVFDLGDNSTFDVSGALNAVNDGGGATTWMLDDDAALTVTDSAYLEHGNNSAFNIQLNQVTDGSAADAQVNIGTNFRILKDDGDNFDISLGDGSDFIVTNDFIFTVSNSDGNNNNITFNLNDNSTLDVNGDFLGTVNDARPIDVIIQLSDNATWDVANDMNVNCVDNDLSSISLAGASRFIVGNDLTYALSANTNSLTWAQTGTSATTILGDLNFSSFGNGSTTLSADDDATFNVTGDFDLDNGTNGDIRIHLNQISNGSASDAQITIGGNFDIDRTDGDQVEFLFSNDGDLNVTGNLDLNVQNTDDNSDSTLMVLNGSAGLNIDGNLIINQNPGRVSSLFVGLQDNATIDVANSWTTNASNSTNSNFSFADNSVATVGSFNFTNAADALFVVLDLDDNGQLNVTNDFLLTNPTTTNTPTQSAVLIDGDAVLSVTGNFTINHTSQDDLLLYLNQNIAGTGAGAQFSVAGNMSLSSSDGDNLHVFVSESGDIDLDGNMSVTYLDSEANNDELAFELHDDATITVDGNATILYNNTTSANVLDFRFVMDGNSAFTVGPAAGPFTTSTFTIESRNGRSSVMTVDGTAQIQVNGDLNLLKTGSLNWSLLANTLSGTGASINVRGNLDIDNTDNDEVMLLQMNQNSILNVDGNVDFQGAVSAGKVEIELNGSSELEIGGNFVRTASPNDFGILDANDNSTVEYNGDSNTQLFAQDAGAGGDEFDYQNVIINNSFATSPQITMEGIAVVHGGVTWTDGVVSSSSTNLLRFDDDATTTGASDASHVQGPVEKIGNDAFSFPTGNQGNYRQIDISAPASVTDVFRAEFIDDNPDDSGIPTTNLGAGLNNVAFCYFWALRRIVGTSNVEVTLSWEVCQVLDLTSVVVSRWDGSNWQNEGSAGTTGAISPAFGTVTSASSVTDFNTFFTLGSTNANNPLPVELLSFDATLEDNEVHLDWATATETDNEQFVVERSADGVNFSGILDQPGAGNSSTVQYYQDVDENPLIGVSYYRLRQIDFDGTSTVSQVRTIVYEPQISEPSVNVYPNPVAGQEITIDLAGFASDETITMQLWDVTGRALGNPGVITEHGGTARTELSISNDLPAGIYMVVIEQGSVRLTERLMVTR